VSGLAFPPVRPAGKDILRSYSPRIIQRMGIVRVELLLSVVIRRLQRKKPVELGESRLLVKLNIYNVEKIFCKSNLEQSVIRLIGLNSPFCACGNIFLHLSSQCIQAVQP